MFGVGILQLTFLFATFIPIFYAFWQFIVLPRSNPIRKVPGPSSSKRVFASHLGPILNAETSALAHERLVKEFGRNIHIKGVGSWDDRLLSLDPIAVSHILNNPSKYQKPWQSRRLITRLLGCGMLAAEGLVHKRQRKVSTPAFSPQNLRGFIPLFFSKADELCARWRDILSESDLRLDVCHWISRATFDVIGQAGFGYDFHAIQDETNEVYLAYKEMFEIAISQGSNVKSILAIYLPVIWKLFPDDTTRIVDKSWEIILRVGRHLVQTKKEAIEHGLTDDKDLLSLMLKSNLSIDIPLDQRISDDDLLFQISTFLFAGSDTTSLALTWTLFLLSKPSNCHIQQRLRDELLTIDSSLPQSVLFSDLDSLPYLDKVIKESLRFIPPVHSSLRVATEADIIPTSNPITLVDGTTSHGVPVAKGTMVHIAVEGFSLDREVWGADAWSFNPDRWDNLPESVKSQPGLYANLLTFSAGPRSCIGMRFSVMEMKILLYSLIMNFNFSDPEEIIKANVVLTRPYVVGKFKSGSQCPIRITSIGS